jgi:hypothetical protein
MKIPESLIQFVWSLGVLNGKHLKTTNDEVVQVIHQGILNHSSGPDFLNAKIKINNTVFAGSVEIHVDGQDWYRHEHQTNDKYNNVVLHVCLNNPVLVKRLDQTEIPTVALESYIPAALLAKYAHLMNTNAKIPCENMLSQITALDWSMTKNRMLVGRLEQRCEQLETYLSNTENNWNQASWILLVRCFGLVHNTQSFEELGMNTPVELLFKHADNVFQLEALLMGQAGILGATGKDAYHTALIAEYSFLQKKYHLKPISSEVKFGGNRPYNFPTIRLAQLASLLYHQPRIFDLIKTLPPFAEIANWFKNDVSSYWEEHFVFGKKSSAKSKIISDNFSQLIFINAIVPLAFYYSKTVGNDAHLEKALGYLQYLKGENNQITKLWKSLGVTNRSADESQSLIYLYKNYCTQKRCLECGIGQRLLKKDLDNE